MLGDIILCHIDDILTIRLLSEIRKYRSTARPARIVTSFYRRKPWIITSIWKPIRVAFVTGGPEPRRVCRANSYPSRLRWRAVLVVGLWTQPNATAELDKGNNNTQAERPVVCSSNSWWRHDILPLNGVRNMSLEKFLSSNHIRHNIIPLYNTHVRIE